MIPIADISFVKNKFLDISYAHNSETQKLDIYLPEKGDAPFPVIVGIHGGAFMMGDKMDIQVLPLLKGIERGFAVVSVGYRLSPEAIFPAQIYDVKAALRFIKANAAKYNLDKNKIVAWGGSAGGHLSALLGLSPHVEALEDTSMGNQDYDCRIQAVVDWFGPTDFLKMDKQLAESGFDTQTHNDANSPESLLIGGQITKFPEKSQYANPINYITDNAPAFFIQHGDRDSTVPYQQSVLLFEELKKHLSKDRLFFELFKNAEHADPAFELPTNLDKVFLFLDNVLKKDI